MCIFIDCSWGKRQCGIAADGAIALSAAIFFIHAHSGWHTPRTNICIHKLYLPYPYAKDNANSTKWHAGVPGTILEKWEMNTQREDAS